MFIRHDLRYVFYAVPSDDRHNEDARLALKGIVLLTFSMDPEDMRALVRRQIQ